MEDRAVEQQDEGQGEEAPGQHRVGRVGVEMVDLAGHRDGGAEAQPRREVAERAPGLAAAEMEDERQGLQADEQAGDHPHAPAAAEFLPVVAHHEEKGGEEDDDPEGPQGEGHLALAGLRLGRIAGQQSPPLRLIDQALAGPETGFLLEPFAEPRG